jgi:hypothetical protein
MRESMKKLLATSAIALVALSGAASAQSVLERVLGQIDNATNLASVNGTFANIAENIGTAVDLEVTVYNDNDAGVTLTEEEYNSGLATFVSDGLDGAITTQVNNGGTVDDDSDDTIEWVVNAGEEGEETFTSFADAEAAAQEDLAAEYAAGFTQDTVVIAGGAVEGINGSINNTLDGIDQATQQAIASAGVSAIEWNMPTVDLGDMATTALGAVNTGDITLGVNSAVDEATTSTTNAITAVVNQLGGSADTGAIVLNVASNMTGVNGSINNVMNEVNGSIGNLSTTALGAVNTGTIVSGVDAAVAGIVGSTSGGSNGQ